MLLLVYVTTYVPHVLSHTSDSHTWRLLKVDCPKRSLIWPKFRLYIHMRVPFMALKRYWWFVCVNSLLLIFHCMRMGEGGRMRDIEGERHEKFLWFFVVMRFSLSTHVNVRFVLFWIMVYYHSSVVLIEPSMHWSLLLSDISFPSFHALRTMS